VDTSGREARIERSFQCVPEARILVWNFDRGLTRKLVWNFARKAESFRVYI